MEAVPGLGDFTSAVVGPSKLSALGLRMRVWWEKDRLTRYLAAGVPSVDSRELALRAGQLTAKSTREVVAASIEDVLERASHRKPLVTAQAPLPRKKVRTVAPELVELEERLLTRAPVRAQGMALALLLLTDPERPLWGTGSADDLEHAIIQVKEQLDAPIWESEW
jgi:hypothetical protein